MIRISFQSIYSQTYGKISPMTKCAMRTFGFWDMTKSKHRNSPEHMKHVQMHQSPINIKDAESEYSDDFKLKF